MSAAVDGVVLEPAGEDGRGPAIFIFVNPSSGGNAAGEFIDRIPAEGIAVEAQRHFF